MKVSIAKTDIEAGFITFERERPSDRAVLQAIRETLKDYQFGSLSVHNKLVSISVPIKLLAEGR